MADVGVVIPAGGSGQRIGGEPKQFRLVGGVPMLLRVVRRFIQHPRVGEIVIALPADVVTSAPDWLAPLVGERLRLVAGGDTRARSVMHGVAALSPECRAVLIHDAARPFVAVETIEAVLAVVDRGGCAIAAIPVSDTIKRATADRLVVETVDRSALWRAQTPQGFPRDVLDRVYQGGALAENAATTDEAGLVESLGIAVALVPDTTTNIKVTTQDDFAVAEALAGR